MDAHRSRSLGMAALIFILISLTAAVFHGAAPVRAEDATTPTPIAIDENTADVMVGLYADKDRQQPLGKEGSPSITTADTIYGFMAAYFKENSGLTSERPEAIYTFPESIVVKDNAGGDLMTDDTENAQKMGTWRIEKNKVIFNYDPSYLNANPSSLYVKVKFEFELKDKNLDDGSKVELRFPGVGEAVPIEIQDGVVEGSKSGVFSQDGTTGIAKITWTINLSVKSYATDVKLVDKLGDYLEFDQNSFKLDGNPIGSSVSIEGQTGTATLSLGSLSQGDHTVTYETTVGADLPLSNGTPMQGKNGVQATWGKAKPQQSPSIEGVSNSFQYDMIKKEPGTGTPSAITWKVVLNKGSLKADMTGYTFTDTLDGKQAYVGNYTVYKGENADETNKIGEGAPGESEDSFRYTFNPKEEDRYATYCIVYQTKLKDENSYEKVSNTASVKKEDSDQPFGESTEYYTRPWTGKTISKTLLNKDEAERTGKATWQLRVELRDYVNAKNPEFVLIRDSMLAAWKQTMGPDTTGGQSHVVAIGDTKLDQGVDWDFERGKDPSQKSNQHNCNIQITITNKVREALDKSPEVVITYKTVTDALPGWYSNFASVDGFSGYSDYVFYYVEGETEPSVEKSVKINDDGSQARWDETFDWGPVDGSNDKGAWIVDWTVYVNRVKTPAGEYYGAGKLNGNDVVVKDELPDGMGYIPGSAKYSLYSNPYRTAVPGREWEHEREKTVALGVLLDPVVDRRAVTFSIPTEKLDNNTGYAKLTYSTAVKRSVVDTSKNLGELTNSASASSCDKVFKAGSDTVQIKNVVLSKTGTSVSNSKRIHYTIFVNESALDLKSGTDYLDLFDVMDSKCTFVPSSLSVSECDNGTWRELAKEQYKTALDLVDEGAGKQQRLTLKLPDKKYLKIEYDVIASGESSKVSLSNKAELEGVADGYVKHGREYDIDAGASGGGTGYGIVVHKVDEKDVTVPLAGATFKLYEIDMDKARGSAGVDGAKTLFSTETTDSDGSATFGTSSNAMASCKLYCLEETEAPAGYNVAQPTWILLKGTESNEQYEQAMDTAKSLLGANTEITSDAEIWVYDAPLEGKATIKAKKVLKGGAFKKGQFSFELKDAEGKVLQTVTNDAEGNVSFPVEYNKAGTYTYTISEVEPEGTVGHVKDHITYDTIAHNVTVEVTNGADQLNAVVSYDDGSHDPPIFTNEYSTTLPEAGGAGLTMTYLAGASLLCFAATWMHARRHRDLDRDGRRE